MNQKCELNDFCKSELIHYVKVTRKKHVSMNCETEVAYVK